MAKEIQELLVAVSQQGIGEVERAFRDLDKSIDRSIKRTHKQSKALDILTERFTQLDKSLNRFDSHLSVMDKAFSDTFSERRIEGFSNKIQQLQKDISKLEGQAISSAVQGDKELGKMVQKRREDTQKAAKEEIDSFVKVRKEQEKEIKKVAETQKRAFSDIALGVGQGSAQTLRQLQQKDFKGAAGTVGGGGRSALNMVSEGGGKYAGLAKSLGSLTRAAGPLATVADILGTLVKGFMDLNAQLVDINKSMLNNVPLTSLAADRYDTLADRVEDGKLALKEFRNTVLTDADLRMLGMKPEEMSQVLGTLEESAGTLSTLRQSGVTTKSALESAQVAALNLGVEANETMSLIGTLSDVTGASFGEAVDSLSLIVSSAQEAGVSTRRFFQVVQGVVGEMGLYNYRLEETAALFSKLTTIMDAKSAEQFSTTLASAIKNASASDRMQMALIAGGGTMNRFAGRAQASAAAGIDQGVLRRQMEALGIGAKFIQGDLSRTMTNLSARQRDALISAVSDANQGQGERLRRFENIRRARRGGTMAMQGIMGDFSQFDQAALQIGNLEKVLGRPLEAMNSALTESMGVNEDQLRMLKALKSEGQGDMARLQMLLEKGTRGEAFEKAAKQMGYVVTEESGKLVDKQGNQIKSFNDLLATMDDDKVKDLQEKQKTAAEQSADLQRTLLDTIKYQLMDMVQGIYRTILDIYDALMQSKFFGGDQNTQARSRLLRDEFELQSQLRSVDKKIDVARAAGRTGEVRTLEGQKAGITSKIQEKQRLRSLVNQNKGISLGDAEQVDKALQASDTVQGGALFRYDGGMGRTFDEREFRGLKMGDATLKSVVTGSGKIIKGEEAIKAFVEEQQKVQEKTGEVVGGVIAGELKDGELFPEDAKKINEKTNKILSESGIHITDKALDKLVQKQLQAKIDQQVIQEIMKNTNRSMASAEMLLRKYRGGDAEARGYVEREAVLEGIMARYGVVPVDAQKAKDVKMVTGGIPFLDLQPGDIIVDQKSLAQTLTGGAGDFVPDLLRGAARTGGGGRSVRSENTLNANFYINGENTSVIRTEVMRVLEEWQRKSAVS